MSDVLDAVSNITKVDTDLRLVYCVVLEPDTVDLQKDVVSVEDIEKACHTYLVRSRIVGEQHVKKANADVVESYIAPMDFEIGDQRVLKGSWVMVVKVHDDELWGKVQAGEITGFSIGGTAYRVPEDE